MDTPSAFLGLILLAACGFAAGWLAAVLHQWGMRRVVVDLEYRLSDLEGRVNREVKIRAAGVANAGKKIEQELLEKITQQQESSGAAARPSGSPSWPDWYRGKMAGK